FRIAIEERDVQALINQVGKRFGDAVGNERLHWFIQVVNPGATLNRLAPIARWCWTTLWRAATDKEHQYRQEGKGQGKMRFRSLEHYVLLEKWQRILLFLLLVQKSERDALCFWINLLTFFRGLVFLQVAGEQDSISVRVIDHRKIHAKRGFVGSAAALVAITDEFAVLCVHSSACLQVELKERTVALCCFHAPWPIPSDKARVPTRRSGIQEEGQSAPHLDLDVRIPFVPLRDGKSEPPIEFQ